MVDDSHDMEDCTQPSPVVHGSFLIPVISHSDHSDGRVPAPIVSVQRQSATQLACFLKPVAREDILSASKLEMYQFSICLLFLFVIYFHRDLNGILDECEQDHNYVSFNSKLTV